MSATRIHLALILLFVLSHAWSQEGSSKTWGISYTPGLSKGKLPSGVSETYGPPGFIDFKKTEPVQFSNHGAIFIRKNGKWLTHHQQFGIANYFYKDIFSYDPATTATDYLWGKRSFVFIEGRYKLDKNIRWGKVSVLPEIGIIGSYLVFANYNLEYRGGLGVTKAYLNLTDQLTRYNYGYTISVKTKLQLTDKFDLEIGPCYKHLLREYRLPGSRVLFFYGLSVDLVHRSN